MKTPLWYTITLWNSIGYGGNKRMERIMPWVALAGVVVVRVAAVHSSAYISFLNRFLSVCLWAAIAPLTLFNDQIKSGVCLHCQHYFRFFIYSKVRYVGRWKRHKPHETSESSHDALVKKYASFPFINPMLSSVFTLYPWYTRSKKT